ncbi:hypothetical protein BDZ97DRAFT_138698 [Flammula alnicola]|nr:hypothetical protein BDZ97DRAFT_138698 [Flammula alnicola]
MYSTANALFTLSNDQHIASVCRFSPQSSRLANCIQTRYTPWFSPRTQSIPQHSRRRLQADSLFRSTARTASPYFSCSHCLFRSIQYSCDALRMFRQFEAPHPRPQSCTSSSDPSAYTTPNFTQSTKTMHLFAKGAGTRSHPFRSLRILIIAMGTFGQEINWTIFMLIARERAVLRISRGRLPASLSEKPSKTRINLAPNNVLARRMALTKVVPLPFPWLCPSVVQR